MSLLCEIAPDAAVQNAPNGDPAQLIDDICAGRVDPDNLSLAEERTIRRFCRACTRASEARIRALVDRGHIKRARRERSDHMKMRSVLLHAGLLSARQQWPIKVTHPPAKQEATRKHRLRMAFEGLPQIGRFLAKARARQFLRAKKSGGYRPITSFYWIDKARQYVLKSALTPFASLHDAQHMLAHDPERRGPAAARKSLLKALNECSDDSVFIQFDIADCYGSISHRWIEESIGLDPAIIQRQIHLGGMLIDHPRGHAIVRASHEATARKGRWGIPQVSRVSSLIAEQAMAAVLKSAAVFSELPSFAWSDNLGIIVPRDRVDDVERLVCEAFWSHGAGPFELTVTRRAVTAEFKFLGIWYRKGTDGAEAFIPEEVICAWEASTFDRLVDCSLRELGDIERHVHGKIAQWAWCPRAIEAREYLLGCIQSIRADLEINETAAESLP